jgi:YbgC/YbaW family acyl-CoA thioester hydrolase
MAYEFRLRRRIEFPETDMGGIVHFARFFEYMEQTEHEFLRSLGLSIHLPLDRGRTGWPRVQASCEFKAPLRFDDMIEVHLLVREKRQKSIHYLHVIRKLTPDGPVEVARGSITTVCVRVAGDEPLKAVAMPPALDAAVEAAPESVLRSLDSTPD